MSLREEDDRLVRRLAMRERPPGKPTMTADCGQMAFLHWTADPNRLQRFLPAVLHVDTYRGSGYVTLSQFKVSKARTRIPWLPVLPFNAATLRTYVVDSTGVPGVWFFSVDASSRALRLLARELLGLPYYHAHAHMNHRQNCVAYRMRRSRPYQSADCRLTVSVGDEVHAAEPGSLEFFLLERYVTFSRRSSSLVRSRLYHAPLAIHEGKVEDLEETLCSAAGLPGFDDPPLFQFCRALRAEVFPYERVTAQDGLLLS